jgi:hypothetical protein
MKQRHKSRWLVAVLLVFPLLVTACGGKSASKVAAEPAAVEHVAGTDVYRITLTAETVKRLEVKTAAVQQSGSETAIPYAAVFYLATGEASAYVNSAPRTFVRQAIVVDRIVGNRAILSGGLSSGTKVVTVGVPELHGIESSAGRAQ